MRAKRMVGVAVGLLLLPFTTATQCDETPTAPRMGVIVKITPGSAACWDELSDAGPRQRVGVEYRPDGIDPSGFPWPARVACVTDAVAVELVEGGRFEG